MARIVFTGGQVFDGHRHRGGLDVLVDGRPDRRPSGRTPARRAPAPRSSTWPAGCCRRASPTPTCTRSRAGSSGSAATCRSSTPARSTSTRSRRTPPRTRSASGSWAAAGRCPPSPAATPTAADLDAVVPDRPVFLPNRDHHGAWVNSRALELAGIDRRHPRPGRRPDRARRRRPARPARCTRARWRSSPGSAAAPRARSTTRRCSTGQAYLHSLGVTGWQDAIVGAYAGMDDPGLDLPSGPPAAATSRLGRGRRALVGAASAASSRSTDLVGRRAATDRRPVPRDER